VVSSRPCLDLGAIAACRRREHPFTWAVIDPTFSDRAIAAELERSFPIAPHQRFLRERGDKRHRLEGWRLEQRDDALAPPWRCLVDEVRGDTYRRAIEAATGLALGDCELELTFWCHSEGCYLDPHPDKPEKVVSHLLYFNEGWTRAMGGALLLLGSARPDDVIEDVVPRANVSVVIVRSERSWHAFDRIAVTTRRRLGMQVVFHRPGLRYTGQTEQVE
jgi:SM-20-related protein